MDRYFGRLSYALYSIDVILRIIGDDEEIDNVEKIVLDQIKKESQDLDKNIDQMNKLIEDNGIDDYPQYTHPRECKIKITSPQVAQFTQLIKKLDKLMVLTDTLWLNGELTNSQRSKANFRWQQRLSNLASRFINLERRARDSAKSQDVLDEVQENAPVLEDEVDSEIKPEKKGAGRKKKTEAEVVIDEDSKAQADDIEKKKASSDEAAA